MGVCRGFGLAASIVVLALPAALDAQASVPLTLDAAIAEALDRSPELRPAVDAVAVAGIQARLAASAFQMKIVPSLSAAADPAGGGARSAGVSVTKHLATGTDVFMTVSSYDFGNTAGTHVRDAGYTIGFSQPLLRGFTQVATSGLATARRAAGTASRDLAAARSALVVHVTSQYFAVIKQQRLVAAADRAATRAADLRTASEVRTHAGLATELDVLRAEVQMTQMAAAAAMAHVALDEARDKLAGLIGHPLGESLVVTEPDSAAADGLDDLPASIDDLMSMALASRVEIADARDRVRDASLSATVSRWNLLPPVSLDVSYTQRGLGVPAGTSGLNALFGGWRVGLSTSYALDRSSEAAAAATSRIAVAGAERAEQEAEQRVAAEVRQLHRQWQTAGATIEIQRQAVDLAERELRLAEIRLERGLATTLDVVNAQNSLYQAQAALIAAELDRRVFALDLRRAVGALDSKDGTR